MQDTNNMEVREIKSFRNFIIEGPLLIKPKKYKDSRGYFFESWNQNLFNESLGKKINFVQDNQSRSYFGVIRGLHFQLPPFGQAKLVRVKCVFPSQVLLVLKEDQSKNQLD